MDIVSFTIQNYRSITKAHKLHLARSTVLVGPNNEGKSNILRALVTAMKVLCDPTLLKRPDGTILKFFNARDSYDWESDYPIDLQDPEQNGESQLTLEFKLTSDEINEFWDEVKSTLNGTLPITISLGPRNCSVKVRKRGIGGSALSAKSGLIADFVAKRIRLDYIPAIRTSEHARDVVGKMLSRELAAAESNPIYVKALQTIADVQKPILDKVTTTLKATLKQFLPAIKDVSIEIPAATRSRALRSCEIIVDDGTSTNLRYKGDGVQSLAALGIMRHASDTAASGRNVVIAIEEPESHLHPKSITELRQVIHELARKHQVVITTHCPLFVDRLNLSQNIIVSDNRARPARSIREIREILGVRAADNLQSAEFILVVEGQNDQFALTALLKSTSPYLKSALEERTLAIDSLAGGSNLAYKLSLIREMLCPYHCFLDGDDAGNAAIAQAREQGLLEPGDVNIATAQGRREAEIEDLYATSLYEAAILNRYRVSLDHPSFRSRRKWSDRMAETFKAQGKGWDGKVEMAVKGKRPVNAIFNLVGEAVMMAA